MLSVFPMRDVNCSGVTRRELLQVGASSAAGLSLASSAYGAPLPNAHRPSPIAQSIIFFFLWGGPSQYETFDPKPEAPSEIRGPFKPIPTSVDGLQFCEELPVLAKMARRYTTIRCMHHDNNLHHLAAGYAQTGQTPITNVRYPNQGAVLARYAPRPGSSLPTFARIGEDLWDCAGEPVGQDAGFLGGTCAPFVIPDPRAPLDRIATLSPPPEVTPTRVERRRTLQQDLDHAQRRIENDATRTYDAAYQRAFSLVTSPAAKRALDLSQEPAAVRERYGDTLPGQGALMARRLIESGVRYVQVNWSKLVAMQGWDTHGTGFNMGGTVPEMKDYLLPTLDRVVPALFEDLEQRGLAQSTVVVVAGEFGRTPAINKVGGRDHWAAVYPALLFGAGIPRGVVIGASDDHGAYPNGPHCTPEDLTTTLYRLLGLDPGALARERVLRPAAGIPGIG